jgi:hypothetical protein
VAAVVTSTTFVVRSRLGVLRGFTELSTEYAVAPLHSPSTIWRAAQLRRFAAPGARSRIGTIDDRNKDRLVVVVKISQVQPMVGFECQRAPLQLPRTRDSQRLREDRDRTEVEQHMIVGTEAEDVGQDVGAIMRSTKCRRSSNGPTRGQRNGPIGGH